MKKYWLILVVPVLLLLWWGLDRSSSATQIHFATVQHRIIESTVSTNGKVEPVQWAAARAETQGVVRAVLVDRGQTVTAGQTLVRLDTTAAESDLANALAQEQSARTEAEILRRGGKAATVADLNDKIRSAQSSVDVAQRNYDSLQRLLAHQAATRLQVDNAKDALDKAKLQLSALQDQKKTLVTPSDKAVAQAKLEDAQAAVALARHRVALGEVRAPIGGTVYQLGESPTQSSGQYRPADLKVGAYLQPGELVALIGKLDQVKVIVYVDEPDLGRVAKGMPVSITSDSRPGQKWWGKVDKLPTQIISLGTRTVGEVSTIIDNPKHDLLPGVSVYATIVSEVVKDALSIPKAALRTIRGENGVYKLAGDSIKWNPVKTGVSDINNVQILSGLKTGDYVADRVIYPSDAEIRDGMRVQPLLGSE